jgi:hypothetical protein
VPAAPDYLRGTCSTCTIFYVLKGVLQLLMSITPKILVKSTIYDKIGELFVNARMEI